MLTAEAMRARLADFPWPERVLDLPAELAAAGGKRAVLGWLAAAWILPGPWLAGLIGLPHEGGDEEAALLFTSGSGGEPRGVVLTHRNLLANCTQFGMLSVLPKSCVLLGCLPIFHSFGFTVTLLHPLPRGSRLVTVPSPLETRRLIDAIRDERVTAFVGAPTFLRPFLKKAERSELSSLHVVVTGAEKLPGELYRDFRELFGIEIIEGYGLTEAPPVTNVNQFDPPVATATAQPQLGKKTGTVGRLLPRRGRAAHRIPPRRARRFPDRESGVLWLRGANLFPGYLDEKGQLEPPRPGGWFATWDVVHFDAEGFLTIEGRRSRFSKIGGEMVPHGTIEERIVELFSLDQSEGPAVFVAGLPDPAQGGGPASSSPSRI